MRSFFAVGVAGMIMTSAAIAADTAKVPAFAWVEVKNLSPISGGNASFGFGDHCSIEAGGLLTKIGDDGDSRVLVDKERF